MYIFMHTQHKRAQNCTFLCSSVIVYARLLFSINKYI